MRDQIIFKGQEAAHADDQANANAHYQSVCFLSRQDILEKLLFCKVNFYSTLSSKFVCYSLYQKSDNKLHIKTKCTGSDWTKWNSNFLRKANNYMKGLNRAF